MSRPIFCVVHPSETNNLFLMPSEYPDDATLFVDGEGNAWCKDCATAGVPPTGQAEAYQALTPIPMEWHSDRSTFGPGTSGPGRNPGLDGRFL